MFCDVSSFMPGVNVGTVNLTLTPSPSNSYLAIQLGSATFKALEYHPSSDW